MITVDVHPAIACDYDKYRQACVNEVVKIGIMGTADLTCRLTVVIKVAFCEFVIVSETLSLRKKLQTHEGVDEVHQQEKNNERGHLSCSIRDRFHKRI